MKKILITGVAGFIASHFLKKLNGESDIVLHVRDEGEAQKINKGGPRVLVGTKGLENLPEGISCVVHLGGTAGGKIKECIEDNVLFTLEILRAMEKARIPRIIFPSAAAIYGNTDKPAREDAPPNPLAPYETTKLIAEEIIKHWVESRRIHSAAILRFNNIYGPGSNHGMMASFIRQAKQKTSISIDGDGTQVREPIYVDDAVDAIKRAIEMDEKGCVLYNISGPEPYTLREIVEYVGNALDKKLTMNLSGKPASPPHTLRLDTVKAKNELGWEPKILLAEGIAKILSL